MMLGRGLLRAVLLVALGGAASGASTAAAAGSAPQAVDGRAAYGLIVKLKNAPTHERAQALSNDGAALGTDRAQALTHDRAQALGAGRAVDGGEAVRLSRVLGQAGFTKFRARPVGRSAQHLDFGRVLSGEDAARIAAQLRSDPDVEWVVANEREQLLQAQPNDPYYADQWWLRAPGGSNANALAARLRGVPGFAAAWARETGRASAVVAILDTGVTAHPELAGRVLPGYDFVSTVEYANDGDGRDADPSDPGDWVSAADKSAAPTTFDTCELQSSSWHGTQLAGIVAAVTGNGSGIASTSWDGRVLPVRVAGKCGAEVADIIDGMRWAAGLAVAKSDGGFLPMNPNPARIVSISFGSSAACNVAYQSTIDELAAHGVVVVAAAGNQHAAPMRPANCKGAIGVAALNRDGFKATYSNFGAELVIATVGGDPDDEGAWGAALGDDGIVTLNNEGRTTPGAAGYARAFGSSYSAPIVAGAISLMLSANPDLSAAQIVAGLRQSARPHVTSPKMAACSADNPGRCVCTTKTCGAGLLDVAEAVRYAQALRDRALFAPKRWPTEVIDNAEVNAAAALGADLPPNGSDDSVAFADSGGGGGGALGPFWLLGLALSVVAVARAMRSRA
ncbi:MAG: S8 family serine peptidase [Burkholderiaceae bacterium]|nr:S8 family serine peptidase [Burkholderiaceae bacterium]